MLSKLFWKKVKGILGELFEDVDDKQFDFSAFGDLLNDSHVELNNLYVKQDYFNDLLPPFHIVRAYIGKISVYGMSEFLAGGKLKVTMEDFFVVLKPQSHVSDPELLTRARQLLLQLVSLYSNPYKEKLLKKVLDRVNDMRLNSSMGSRKQSRLKKDLTTSIMKWLMKGVVVNISRIHVRCEDRSLYLPQGSRGNTIPKCDALGFMLTEISLNTKNLNRSTRQREHQEFAEQNQQLSWIGRRAPKGTAVPGQKGEVRKEVNFTGLQIYCDYEVDCYWGTHIAPGAVSFHEIFLYKWANERHIYFLRPMDFSIVLGIQLVRGSKKSNSRVVMTKVEMNLQELMFSIDHRQVDILNSLIGSLTNYFRKQNRMHLVPQVGLRNENPPVAETPSARRERISEQRVQEQQGFFSQRSAAKSKEQDAIEILPTLIPAQPHRTAPFVSVLHIAKMRSANRATGRFAASKQSSSDGGNEEKWTRIMWKYAINCVMDDLVRSNPWRWLGKTTNMQKRYKELYKRTLRPRSLDDIEENELALLVPNYNKPLSHEEMWEKCDLELQITLSELLLLRGTSRLEAHLEYEMVSSQSNFNRLQQGRSATKDCGIWSLADQELVDSHRNDRINVCLEMKLEMKHLKNPTWNVKKPCIEDALLYERKEFEDLTGLVSRPRKISSMSEPDFMGAPRDTSLPKRRSNRQPPNHGSRPSQNSMDSEFNGGGSVRSQTNSPRSSSQSSIRTNRSEQLFPTSKAQPLPAEGATMKSREKSLSPKYREKSDSHFSRQDVMKFIDQKKQGKFVSFSDSEGSSSESEEPKRKVMPSASAQSTKGWDPAFNGRPLRGKPKPAGPHPNISIIPPSVHFKIERIGCNLVKDFQKDRSQAGRPVLLSAKIEDLSVKSKVFRSKVLLIGLYISTCEVVAKVKSKGEDKILYTSPGCSSPFLSCEALFNPSLLLTFKWGKEDIFQDPDPDTDPVIWRVMVSMAPMNLDLPSSLSETIKGISAQIKDPSESDEPERAKTSFQPGYDLAIILSGLQALKDADRSQLFKVAKEKEAPEKHQPNPPTNPHSVILEDRKSAVVWHERLFRGNMPSSFAFIMQSPQFHIFCAMTPEEILMKSTNKNIFNIYGSDSEIIMNDEVITEVTIPKLGIRMLRSETPKHQIAFSAGSLKVKTQCSSVAFEMLTAALRAHFNPLFIV